MPHVSLDILGTADPHRVTAILTEHFALLPDARPGGCAIVVVEDLSRAEYRAQIGYLFEHAAPAALVLVTSTEASNLKHLAKLPADDVVGIDQVETELAPAIRALLARELLERLGERTISAQHLDARLRRALAYALCVLPPARTAKRVASQTGITPKELSMIFHKAVGGPKPTMPDVLHAIALHRVLRRARSRRELRGTYAELGLDERTMARAANTLFGRAPSDLLYAPDIPGEWLSEFLARIGKD